ncbi:MAG TPA: WS/DGAT domain-containing protein [Myxococcota bacterium]|nr:WS/DGAT domain-containing protein [Myxococcota bacterium]
MWRRADVAALELAGLDAPPSLLGARLQAFVPVAPRLPGVALEVTLTRVADRMSVSLCSDASRVPDLAPLADATAAAFDELRRAAAQPPARKGRAAGRPRRTRPHLEAEA